MIICFCECVCALCFPSFLFSIIVILVDSSSAGGGQISIRIVRDDGDTIEHEMKVLIFGCFCLHFTFFGVLVDSRWTIDMQFYADNRWHASGVRQH